MGTYLQKKLAASFIKYEHGGYIKNLSSINCWYSILLTNLLSCVTDLKDGSLQRVSLKNITFLER